MTFPFLFVSRGLGGVNFKGEDLWTFATRSKKPL